MSMSTVKTAASEFVMAETEAAQAEVLERYTVGQVRKGLRHFALQLEAKGETEAAAQAWALRDELTVEVRTDEVVHFEPEFELAS